MTVNKPYMPKYWQDRNNTKIVCKEKIKVMNDNINELEEILTDTYDEAILMGIDERQLKQVLLNMVKYMKNNLKNG